MKETSTPELIEKELVASLSFHYNSIEVDQRPDIMKMIEKATLLGNAHHGKVSIIFQDDTGLKRVDTTVWANGAKYICLKGGVWIPIDHIVEVKF